MSIFPRETAISKFRLKALNANVNWFFGYESPSTLRLTWGLLTGFNNQQPFWICIGGKVGQRNHVIIVTSSFSKSFVVKLLSAKTKTKKRCVQIPLLLFRDRLV